MKILKILKEMKLLHVYYFAAGAHAGQVRKYTGEAYVWHPLAVAQTVFSVTDNPDMICAAVLHDTVEDTPVTIQQIDLMFGAAVSRLVHELTDKSRPEDGNRAVRKAIDREFLLNASDEAQTIKLADMIDNSISIAKYDPDFAKIYMEEKRALLKVLTRGNPELYKIAKGIVDVYFETRG